MAVACPLLEGIDLSGACGVLVLIAASKGIFKPAESPKLPTAAMNTIRRYAAGDAHVIDGTTDDENLGDKPRVTVIATGQSSTRRAQITPPLSVVLQPMHRLRTGTDNVPALSQVAQTGPTATMQAGHAGQAAQVTQATQQHSDEGLNAPGVWRTHRTHAAAKMDALASNGMDEIEIPAFWRKQAD